MNKIQIALDFLCLGQIINLMNANQQYILYHKLNIFSIIWSKSTKKKNSKMCGIANIQIKFDNFIIFQNILMIRQQQKIKFQYISSIKHFRSLKNQYIFKLIFQQQLILILRQTAIYIQKIKMEVKQIGAPAITLITCVQGKKPAKICHNDFCKYQAFICDLPFCKCQMRHENCKTTDFEKLVGKIMSEKKKLSKEDFTYLRKIGQTFDHIIQYINHQKRQMDKIPKYYGLNRHAKQFVSLINKKKSDNIIGGFVSKVFKEINQQLPSPSILNILAEIQAKSVAIRQILQSTTFKAHQNVIPLAIRPRIDSKILTRQLQDKLRAMFEKPPTNFKLIFRASQNQFAARKFHRTCDGKAETVVIVQNYFQKIFGGYTPVPWRSNQYEISIPDYSNKSFLFSLTHNEKYFLIDPKQAIRAHWEKGPMFGTFLDTDLVIGDGCNLNSQSFAKLPGSYGNDKYTEGKRSYFKWVNDNFQIDNGIQLLITRNQLYIAKEKFNFNQLISFESLCINLNELVRLINKKMKIICKQYINFQQFFKQNK